MMKLLAGKIFDSKVLETFIEKNNKKIPVIIKKNIKSKKMRLKICNKTKKALITTPVFVSKKIALSFALKNFDWIEQKILQIPERIVIKENLEITILGDKYKIIYTKEKIGGAKFVKDAILVCGDKAHLSRRVQDLLKSYAKRKITEKAKEFALKIDKKINKITVKDTKSRWGSCSAKGNLNFSWRLVLAPLSVFEAVIAHEVAHMAELNHSAKFKKILATLYPDYKNQEKWLKENGSKLHAYE